MIRFLILCAAIVSGTLSLCFFASGLLAEPQWQIDAEQQKKRYMDSCMKEHPEYKCIEMWVKLR